MKYRSTTHRRRRRMCNRRRPQTPLLGIILASSCLVISLLCLVMLAIGNMIIPNETKKSDSVTVTMNIDFITVEPITTPGAQSSNGYSMVDTTAIPITLESPTPITLSSISPEPIPMVEEDNIQNHIGETDFDFNGNHFHGYDMPDKYYPGIDYSFEPFMDYRKITNKSTPAYAISHNENAYTDSNGLRRYKTGDDEFKINDEDDYIIALGTFYKPAGECGSRYLIVTTTGMFTIITGDEKDDRDTDERNMFSLHVDGTCAGIVEWIVNADVLESTMKRAGTITAGPVEALKGTITHIYRIN